MSKFRGRFLFTLVFEFTPCVTERKKAGAHTKCVCISLLFYEIILWAWTSSVPGPKGPVTVHLLGRSPY